MTVTGIDYAYADTELFFEEKGNYAAIKENEFDNVLDADYVGPYDDEDAPKYIKESFNVKISDKIKKALKEFEAKEGDGNDLVKRLMDQGFVHIKLNYVEEKKKAKLYGEGKEETKKVITKIKTTATEYIVNEQSAKNAAELYNIILSSKKAITTTYDKKKAQLRDWTTESRKDPEYSAGRRRRLVPGQDNAVAVANGGHGNPRNNVAPFRSIGSLVMWSRVNRRWDPHCTAWLISDRHIVTNAHCVHRQGNRYAIPQMEFFPGHTGNGRRAAGGLAAIGRDGEPPDPQNLGYRRALGFIHVPAAITEAYLPTIWINDGPPWLQNMAHTHDWAILVLRNPINGGNPPPIHIGVVMLDPAGPNPPYAQPILTPVAHANPACASGMFFAGYPKRWGHNQITNRYAGGSYWDVRSNIRHTWQFHDLVGGGGSGSPYIETATGIAYGLHANGPMVHGAHGSLGLEFTIERYISLCSKLNARPESYQFCPQMAIAPNGLVIQPVQQVVNGKMEYFDEYQQYKQNIYVKNKYFHNNKYKNKYSQSRQSEYHDEDYKQQKKEHRINTIVDHYYKHPIFLTNTLIFVMITFCFCISMVFIAIVSSIFSFIVSNLCKKIKRNQNYYKDYDDKTDIKNNNNNDIV